MGSKAQGHQPKIRETITTGGIGSQGSQGTCRCLDIQQGTFQQGTAEAESLVRMSVTPDTRHYWRCWLEDAQLFGPEELALDRLLGRGVTGPVFEAR